MNRLLVVKNLRLFSKPLSEEEKKKGLKREVINIKIVIPFLVKSNVLNVEVILNDEHITVHIKHTLHGVAPSILKMLQNAQCVLYEIKEFVRRLS